MYWMVARSIIDLMLIVANCVLQVLICRNWKNVDYFDCLLFSLSISNLFCESIKLVIAAWSLVEKVTPTTIQKVCYNRQIVMKIFDSVFLFSMFMITVHVIAITVEPFCANKNLPNNKLLTIAKIWISSLVLALTFLVVSIFSFNTKIGEN